MDVSRREGGVLQGHCRGAACTPAGRQKVRHMQTQDGAIVPDNHQTRTDSKSAPKCLRVPLVLPVCGAGACALLMLYNLSRNL